MKRANLPLLAVLALVLAACSEEPAAQPDAGLPVTSDAGFDAGLPPPCTVGCNEIPDAGPVDAGDPVEVKLTTVTPARGPIGGGVSVTLEGKGFVRGFAERSTDARRDTRIYFGTNEASVFQIIDDDTIEVTAPPNPVGEVEVIVHNPNGTARCADCFTYFTQLEFRSITPASGGLEGGNTVELRGRGFAGGVTVLFGDARSPQVVVEDDQLARAVVPSAAVAGPVDVRVFNKNGVGEIRRGYTYEPSLAITAIEPAYGPLAGGGTVVISGARFEDVVGVGFGGVDAGPVQVRDAGTIEVTLPAGAAPGAVDVTVTTQAGSATLSGGFVYFDHEATGLTLAGAVPARGPANGQNRVRLVGTGFDHPSAEFFFGTARANPTGPATAHAVEVEAPAGAANSAVDLVVNDGANEARLAGGYRYNVRLDEVDPTAGAAAGGELVTLRGAGFTSGMEVYFGVLPGTELTIVDDQTATVKTPPGAGGPVNVTVRMANDEENKDLLAGGFTYADALSIGRISPDTGAIAGGTWVTIMGTGFEPGVIVTIGGGPLKDLRVVDRNVIVGRTPPFNVGPATVEVVRSNDRDALVGGFTYFDPRNTNGGSSGGPLNGTLNVTVLDNTPGMNGAPVSGALVMLGSDPTTPFQGFTDARGQITLSDPQLVKAQQVTVSKEGYEAITVARQESQNLTVFISVNAGEGGGSPSFPPSAPPAIISGKVTGFKLPRELSSDEVAYAEVWLAPTSLYFTAPLGRSVTAAQRDGSGERWRVTQDGGTYTIFSSRGLKTVYAVFGIFNKTTQVFTPLLMGIRRGVSADADQPAVNQDILLDMHLDQEVPITIDNPLSVPATGQPAINEVYAYLDLGGEGVIPMGKKSEIATRFSFGGFPRLGLDSFIFLNHASAGGQIPESYFFRRQFGELADGVTIGPMLGMLEMTSPSFSDPFFTGEIRWTMGGGPAADMHQVLLMKQTMTGAVTLWTGIAPGTERVMTIPPPVIADMKTKIGQGEQPFVQLIAIRSPRFDYNHWSYGQLSLDSWTSFGLTLAPLIFP